jgi:hypothetical protein
MTPSGQAWSAPVGHGCAGPVVRCGSGTAAPSPVVCSHHRLRPGASLRGLQVQSPPRCPDRLGARRRHHPDVPVRQGPARARASEPQARISPPGCRPCPRRSQRCGGPHRSARMHPSSPAQRRPSFGPAGPADSKPAASSGPQALHRHRLLPGVSIAATRHSPSARPYSAPRPPDDQPPGPGRAGADCVPRGSSTSTRSMSPRPTSTRRRRDCVTGSGSLAHSRRRSHPARSPTSAPTAGPRSPRSMPDGCAGH